ncbi:MAG TPA: hemerythrin domain-containing protein [Candidatus Sulfotelmatobacter sp.]|nr:hemerythrin domain-containing protein [Candidatus Sulfotelmatobacter sp.]
MPVQIGTKTHNFTDPTGLLSDCHRRVEMFLGTLDAVAKVIDRPVTEETSRALESALRYFGQAAPKHTADEEESLFPRLRRIDDPEVQSALEQLDRLEDDHRWAAPLHAEVERLGAQYLLNSSLSDAEIVEFRDAVARLVSMYKQHLSIEDGLIFPLASRMLSHTEKAAIANEMADRRNVKMVTAISEGRKNL